MKREVGLGSHSLSHSSTSLISHTVFVDGKHHERREESLAGLPVPFFPPSLNKPYGFCGRIAPGKKKRKSHWS